MIKRDLTNQRFGFLTVVREAPMYISPKGYRKTMWHCICDCGNECDIMGSHLLSRHTQSCGCHKFDSLIPPQVTDLVGQKFGQLTVLYRMPNRMVGKNSRVVWHCVCDCGRETDVLALLLTGGQTKSCGCRSVSHAERTFAEYLTKSGFRFDTQYHPDGLIGCNKGNLKYDFVIYDVHGLPVLLIELDGIQHYKSIHYFGGDTKYRQVRENDKIKCVWAKAHHIDLLRINVSKCTTDKSFYELYDKYLGPYIFQIDK